MKISKFLMLLLLIFICSIQYSCARACAVITVTGQIHYTTGTYGKVTRIDFSVSGGEPPYSFCYAKTATSDEDYARSVRKSIGTGSQEGDYYYDGCDGYVSTGWHYWI